MTKMDGGLLAKHSWPSRVHVLIPAYNAGELLRGFLPDLIELVPPGRVCVVDDGSSDDTAAVCRHQAVGCLVNDRNLGKGAALLRGFEYLMERGAVWILTMDADGQHAVGDIAGFIATMELFPDAGMIIGARSMRVGKMPLARIASNRLTSRVVSCLTGRSILDSQSGYRLYSRKLLETVSLHCPRFEMESEVILKACRHGFDIRFVSVQTLYFGTRSHISHVGDTIRWIRAVLRIHGELRRRSPAPGQIEPGAESRPAP
jgi:glycosyltransferase involved in cell wall biosynthesis